MWEYTKDFPYPPKAIALEAVNPVKPLVQLPLLSCVTFLVAKELGKACKTCLFIISNQCVFLLFPASFLVYLVFQLKMSIQKKTF